MVALIFNAPPIDHEAVDLGEKEWITTDGEILEWRAMGLWHLMGAYKTMRGRIENVRDEIDAGWRVASYVSGEMASYDIERQLQNLSDSLPEMEDELADLKRYIEYRTSIGNVHGD